MRVALRALTLLLVLAPAMASGACAAVHHSQKTAYDRGVASGLGVPLFARLAASLPSPAG